MLLVAASYEEGKEQRNRRKGNGRKEVKKLAAGERNNQHRCYRHKDEMLIPGAEIFIWLKKKKKKGLSKGNAGSYSTLWKQKNPRLGKSLPCWGVAHHLRGKAKDELSLFSYCMLARKFPSWPKSHEEVS